ncbi:hypothetical protein IU451_29080 [Nocardia cyriacigeorgica]|uniref:hypothetical protein n=1 Tax=Nocardia cyriacigeorgica TaxID=135487 RepID=UPI001895B63B|nr:hypothetical protein [Nocardia cyriacigeorgica]MBF6326558.1 hypothetical protein [Nocardia cyriacigeorgica]
MNLTVELFDVDSKRSRITLTPTRTTVKVGSEHRGYGFLMLAMAALVRERMGEISQSWRGVYRFHPDQEYVAITVETASRALRQRHVLAMSDVEGVAGAYA